MTKEDNALPAVFSLHASLVNCVSCIVCILLFSRQSCTIYPGFDNVVFNSTVRGYPDSERAFGIWLTIHLKRTDLHTVWIFLFFGPLIGWLIKKSVF